MSGISLECERDASHVGFIDEPRFIAGMRICLPLHELVEGKQYVQTTKLSFRDKACLELQDDDDQGLPPYAENRLVVVSDKDLVLSTVRILTSYSLGNGEFVWREPEQPLHRLTREKGWINPPGVDDCGEAAKEFGVDVDKIVLGYFMNCDGEGDDPYVRVASKAKERKKLAEVETLKDPSKMTQVELDGQYGEYKRRWNY